MSGKFRVFWIKISFFIINKCKDQNGSLADILREVMM